MLGKETTLGKVSHNSEKIKYTIFKNFQIQLQVGEVFTCTQNSIFLCFLAKQVVKVLKFCNSKISIFCSSS